MKIWSLCGILYGRQLSEFLLVIFALLSSCKAKCCFKLQGLGDLITKKAECV